MSKHTAPAGHEVAPTASARRAARPRAMAGGLAVALMLPAVLMPAPGLAQTTSGESGAPAMPELSPDPVATAKKPAKKARPKSQVKGTSTSGTRSPARYKVRSGQNLWVISERLAGPGASATKIANTLVAVWNLNDIRIGTGNPDMLPVGVTLRIPASVR